MSNPSLLEILKERALSLDYTLVAEDFDGGPDFFDPDTFIVRDATGATYRILVENLSGSYG